MKGHIKIYAGVLAGILGYSKFSSSPRNDFDFIIRGLILISNEWYLSTALRIFCIIFNAMPLIGVREVCRLYLDEILDFV